jgi:hypothetical protein
LAAEEYAETLSGYWPGTMIPPSITRAFFTFIVLVSFIVLAAPNSASAFLGQTIAATNIELKDEKIERRFIEMLLGAGEVLTRLTLSVHVAHNPYGSSLDRSHCVRQ